MKKKGLLLIMGLLLLCGVVGIVRKAWQVGSIKSTVTKYTVVLDAGHGGVDPGKVGVNDALEKDINLSIVLKLQRLLEENDVNVIMIRTEDNGLYQMSDSNKKNADLRKRVEIINTSGADIAVSIHQNAFQEESSKGAQVFYHSNSAEGKELANILQEQIKETIGDGNHRVAKANESYYMLKKTQCPLVIVECGFLSNWTEAKLLCDENYQEKMAWAIHLGIMSYLNSLDK
ncbi:MAG TPA: N-acetylmuramoyl-L-alanine amidase [Lachnospiraceae bacterium]|nr:N-acetylmuramoyl-L-alanine amidase [Lachnospiraceae bacterium]